MTMQGAKPPNSCSRVGAVYIYTNQPASTRHSNKSKQILKIVLKMITQWFKNLFKKHQPHESKTIDKSYPKYSKSWNIGSYFGSICLPLSDSSVSFWRPGFRNLCGAPLVPILISSGAPLVRLSSLSEWTQEPFCFKCQKVHDNISIRRKQIAPNRTFNKQARIQKHIPILNLNKPFFTFVSNTPAQKITMFSSGCEFIYFTSSRGHL